MSDLLTTLRAEFDATFAAEYDHEHELREGLLVLTVGERTMYAPASRLSAVVRCPPVTRVPGSPEALLGVGAVRGRLRAVYGLSSLLGQQQPPRPPWLLLCAAHPALALAVGVVAGYRSVPLSQLHPLDADAGLTGIRDIAHHDGTAVPVIDLERIEAKIVAWRD